VFTPDRFELDMSSCENVGMMNTYNGCDITFNTGLREVEAIDLLFKFSNSSVVYKVDQFVKTEEGWGDNITIPTPIRFTNNKVFSILPEDQYFRSYDNVPESVVASTMAGNRGMEANYVEGKDLIDKNGAKVVMDYSVGFTSVSPESLPLPTAKLSATSIFDASSIVDGKIRLDFTGKSLKKGGALISIISSAVNPSTPQVLERAMFKILGGLLSPENFNNVSSSVFPTKTSTLVIRSPVLKFKRVPVVDCATISDANVSLSYSIM